MATTQKAGNRKDKNVPEVLKAPAGTVSGPKGKKLVDAKPAEEVKSSEITEEQREGERRQSQSDASMKFATAQLTTPAAHAPALTAEQQRRADFDNKVAELAREMGVEAPQLVKQKASTARLQQNNVTRPADGTVTGNVWKAADEVSFKQGGAPAQVAQVKSHPLMKGVNDNTVKTQYARWRQYNGIKGRLQTIKPVQAEGQYDGMPVVK